MDYVALGKRIREERRKQNLTQEQLADKVSVTYSYIGQIERGERGISLETLINVTNCLGVTVDFLLANYLDNDDEYLRQVWIKLVKSRTDKEQEMIINVVKAIVNGLE